MIKINMAILIAGMSLVGCTGNNLVEMETQVKQLNDLRDFDQDGVVKAREKCAETFSGSVIDNYGCGQTKPIDESINLDLKFANDSAKLLDGSLNKLQVVVDFLNKYPDSKINVEGHTSKVGSQVYNQALSQRRATAIEKALVEQFAIAPDRVTTNGYGFSQLTDFTDTEAAHAKNRRIMVNLSGQMMVNDLIWTIYTVDDDNQ